jgi:hypothetical protein
MNESVLRYVMLCSICGLLLISLTVLPATAISLLSYPDNILITNGVRGNEYERQFDVIYSCDTTSLLNFTIPDDTGKWIYLSYLENKTALPDTIIVPPTKEESQRISVLARIRLPSDVANGLYKSTIDIELTPERSSLGNTTGALVSDVTDIDVSVYVTGAQIIEGTVNFIHIEDTEVGLPVTVVVELRNQGTVVISPEISVDILDNQTLLGNVVNADTSLKVDETKSILTEYNATPLEVGNYTAQVTVKLNESEIASEETLFRVLPYGSLTRQGNFTALSYEGERVTERQIKIVGTFQNTGRIVTKTKMVCDVYRDGSFISTLTSDEFSVPTNSQEQLAVYYVASDPGNYAFKAYMVYENKKTDIRELTLPIQKGEAVTTAAPLLPVVPVIGLILAAILLAGIKKMSK